MERRIRGLLIAVCDYNCYDSPALTYLTPLYLCAVQSVLYKATSTCASSVTIVTLMQMRSELIVYTSTNTLLNPDPSHPLDPHHH